MTAESHRECKMATRNHAMTLSLPSDREIVTERIVKAPRKPLFRAYTDPNLNALFDTVGNRDRMLKSGMEKGRRPFMNITLWITQALLALLFLFAGGTKLIMPIEEMTKQMTVPLPGVFLRFIGVCEVLGGLGLVLPWLLRIRPFLTPLAAAGLVVIMVGATAITLMTGEIVMALMPLVVGILCVFIAYGRWRLAPSSTRS
jgi:uncharacterized membrane protein YphA (DoxX/SURF4 family)